MKYIGVKIKFFNYWIWFETDNYTVEDDQIVAKNGWRTEGEELDLSVDKAMLEGVIHTNTLQYNVNETDDIDHNDEDLDTVDFLDWVHENWEKSNVPTILTDDELTWKNLKNNTISASYTVYQQWRYENDLSSN